MKRLTYKCTVPVKSNANEICRITQISEKKLQNFASDEILMAFQQLFQTSIVQVSAKFHELGEKVRRNFAVLDEISPQTFVSARRKFASYKLKFIHSQLFVDFLYLVENDEHGFFNANKWSQI